MKSKRKKKKDKSETKQRADRKRTKTNRKQEGTYKKKIRKQASDPQKPDLN